jgi:predicted TPR repeat methyltransferase
MGQAAQASQHLRLSEALALAEQTRINGHYSEAEALYSLILQAAPENVTAMHGLSVVLCQQGHAHGDAHLAAKYYCRAVIANRENIKSSMLLGMSYSSLGRIEEAADVYYQWLQKDPGNPIAEHFYAACSGKNIPERASNSYIENTFDGFSEDFDEHLTSNLSYKVPQLIGGFLTKNFIPEGNLQTLDAGCGTGLCGKVLAPYAKTLTGVDLSTGMLAAAQRLAIYDALIKEEITEFLFKNHHAFDMVVMADTLIYFGSLKTVFAAISNALNIGGLFVFSIENGSGYTQSLGSKLNCNGRYSHKKSYVLDILQNNGFSLLSITPHTLRMEMGNPVDGMLVMVVKGSKFQRSRLSLKRNSQSHSLFTHES